MCWYSQYARLSTRKAIEGEELVVQDFPGHHHRWVASQQNPQKAVCLADGCKLRLNAIPEELQKLLRIGPEAVAEFRETYQPLLNSLFDRILPHFLLYDVLVFPNGHHLEVSLLPLGMKIDVLSPAVVTPVREEQEEDEPETIYVLRPKAVNRRSHL